MRQKILSILLTISLATCAFCGCGTASDTVTKSDFYFDTVISITLYGQDKEPYIDHCFDLASKYENLFSNTIADSDIYKINHADGAYVAVSDETIELLELGIYYSKLSGGTFDITVGNLSELWNFSDTEDFHLPEDDDISYALSQVDYTAIVISGNQVALKNTAAAIDLGGIAKGYIADRMKEYLISVGITEGLINLGGNVLALGPKQNTSDATYHIGIQEPFSEDGSVACSVNITDTSVVTSGTYQRYAEIDGKLYHHIIDLHTGYPCENDLTSVTIIGASSVDCDALSTITFLKGKEEGTKFIEALDGYEAIFIDIDGNITSTDGVEPNIIE